MLRPRRPSGDDLDACLLQGVEGGSCATVWAGLPSVVAGGRRWLGPCSVPAVTAGRPYRAGWIPCGIHKGRSSMDRQGSATRGAGGVLAAGAGSRLRQPKALLRLGGDLLLDRAVRTLRQADCAPVVVVLGARAEEAVAAVDGADLEVVTNSDWPTGMGSSLRAGLAS